MSSERHGQRLQQGPGAVFAPSHAAGLLPGRDRDNLAWLRREGLVRSLDGRPVVVWGEVLDRIASGRGPDEDRRRRDPPAACDLPRVALDAIH